jgi:histidinol dehydrogenase
MNIVSKKELTKNAYNGLMKRPGYGGDDIESIIREICLNVKKRGDEAVREYGDLYEPTAVDVFRVSEAEFAEAETAVADTLRRAIGEARENIRTFHEAQRRGAIDLTIAEGVRCRREVRPYITVGLYIPAGSAPLPSTVLMLGVPALIAGCGRIVLCSPPNGAGKIDPAVLVTAAKLGIREVYKAGGAQAIAAMGYGTESIPKVEKIFGPGSRYVARAKQFVATDPDGCAIDLEAGPSELLIIADDTANPDFVAIDLLSQAEHDPYSQVVLVTDDPVLAEKVSAIVRERIDGLTRRKIIEQSVDKSFILLVDTIDDAIEFSNRYAPEHLSIVTNRPDDLIPRIQHAGSVFLGSYSPVTAGDYASGTNHTLPTGGAARWYGGLTLESFQKTITFQSLTKEGLRNLSETLVILTGAEGMEAHKLAVTERLQ